MRLLPFKILISKILCIYNRTKAAKYFICLYFNEPAVAVSRLRDVFHWVCYNARDIYFFQGRYTESKFGCIEFI